MNYNNENIKSNSLLSGPSGLLSICCKTCLKYCSQFPHTNPNKYDHVPHISFFFSRYRNVFQIWSTLAGYKELVGVFEPVKKEKYFG